MRPTSLRIAVTSVGLLAITLLTGCSEDSGYGSAEAAATANANAMGTGDHERFCSNMVRLGSDGEHRFYEEWSAEEKTECREAVTWFQEDENPTEFADLLQEMSGLTEGDWSVTDQDGAIVHLVTSNEYEARVLEVDGRYYPTWD